MADIKIIDCTTCKYGYEDEQLGIPMCHHPKKFFEYCVDFNMHEEKMNKEITNDLLESKPTRAVQLPDGRYVTEELARQMAHEGLDEAVGLWIAGVFLAYSVPDTLVKELREIAEKSFKAGAEWAMEQGLVYEGEARHHGESGDTVYVENPSSIRKKYAKMFKTGDKVIVQIRKKD